MSKNIFSTITAVYQKIKFGPSPNLLGDRDLEYSFIAANLPNKTGRVLDFGSGGTPLSLIAELKGHNVTAIDLIKYNTAYKTAAKFMQGDILNTNQLKKNYFDIVINCSSIEHVGLSGRYGITKYIADGDLDAMNILRNVLKKGGIMLLTIPVGQDTTVESMHRIYGEERLPKLISGFTVLKQQFWIKDSQNKWNEMNTKRALSTQGSKKYYGIGCFVLKK